MSSAIYLSDGVVNLALLNFTGEKGSGREDMKNFVGAHHFGFIVEDIAETQQKVEAAGGTFFMALGDNAEKENFERKFRDPDGIIIDISRKGWAGSKANPQAALASGRCLSRLPEVSLCPLCRSRGMRIAVRVANLMIDKAFDRVARIIELALALA